MNIQAIIFSIILAGGLVLLCVSTRTGDEDTEITKQTYTVLLIIGSVMTAIGAFGYLYTIYEVIMRAQRKFKAKKLRKLEQQVVRRRTETMLRTGTIVVTMENGNHNL